MINATGITARRTSRDITPGHDQLIKRTTQIGAELVKAVMEQQGWDSIDCFFDTSASLPAEMGELVLSQAGINTEKVVTKPYRLACAGAVTAFVDSLADPQMRDKRVIICALEPLSRHLSPEQNTLKRLSLPTIFGDDYAAIAYRTSDFEAVCPRTLIIYDGATIHIRTDYDLPQTDENSIPEHYSFGKGGREIASISQRGFFLKIEEPKGDMPSEMDGMLTHQFFVRHTIDVMDNVVDCARKQGVSVQKVIMHQPSLQVNRGIQNRAAKKAEAMKHLRIPDFLLGKVGRSNSSSATTLVIWQHMAKTGYVSSDEPFLLSAPGIGGAITAAVVVPRKIS